MNDLPVTAVLPTLRRILSSRQSAVLASPTGSGKTTLVPLELLHEPWLQGRKILLLEPRRLAARAAAARMAELLGERVGEQVGYRIRLGNKVSRRTRIEVLTEGILSRRLQHDPELQGVGLVIFDEFHERSLHADLALAFCLDVMAGLREDLRILVMSATLDTGAVSDLLEGAPVVEGKGRSYPVELHYLGDPPAMRRLPDSVAAAVLQVLQEQQGDLLVFLPGVGEIKQTVERLERLLTNAGSPLICPLYGDLGREAQDRAIRPDPGGRRRIVLATSIAETSLTIEGVTCVVDSGWSRMPRFLPGIGLTRLETVPVSRAAADQRTGRAGRLCPGHCYRLWSEQRQDRLPAQHPPEIQEADLAPLALDLAQWGVCDPAQLRWLDAPPAGAFSQARELLESIDALDQQGRITKTGQQIARLPLHPRLGHMLLVGVEHGESTMAADIAALLSEQDIFRRGSRETWSVDVERRLTALNHWREQSGRQSSEQNLDRAGCRRVDKVSRQWRQLSKNEGMSAPGKVFSPGGLLAMAYPDRIAKQRSHGSYLLASGRGAILAENDALAGERYIVVAKMDAGRTEGRIQLAAALNKDEIKALPDLRLRQVARIEWDSARCRVVARGEERLGALLLASFHLEAPDPETLKQAMLQGIEQMGMESLPWTDKLRQWQTRVVCMRAWMPEDNWPDLTDRWLTGHLGEWLEPWLDGVTRREHLQRLNLADILQNLLSWEQRGALDEALPTHLTVPSGSRKALTYEVGKAPVLAVRLQEMFGLADTPRICCNRIQIMLHLLSPAQRPIQVTQDLRGFWDRTYSEVKKELKGRYPKHHWPDDPWQAQATARAKPRRR
ncbi:MAG: ATP-dependent helicase HrpB [gamma proteobacterium endosymbiont of Lamellibrachia anaximandri]|nr:ATP-dependent helicase HrpB [gamma proteobacterium endosymbiont of Lamellibrachia anaximandri]MBL3534237.1 ATP-dependent helicase HrpB [gamma proteobacterium endosymbiont of Lamellibrachia anaximandri]